MPACRSCGVDVKAAYDQIETARRKLTLVQEKVTLDQELLKQDKRNFKRRLQAAKAAVQLEHIWNTGTPAQRVIVRGVLSPGAIDQEYGFAFKTTQKRLDNPVVHEATTSRWRQAGAHATLLELGLKQPELGSLQRFLKEADDFITGTHQPAPTGIVGALR